MGMCVEQSEVTIRLNQIFINRFDMDLFAGKIGIEDNLLSKGVGLKARDLIYLLFDIEKEFGIRIADEDVDCNKFSTISNIIDLIQKELKEV